MVTYNMSRVLKEHREKLGNEIKEIAQITRIKGSYLKAIEDEDYNKLPVEVYTRGYIRKYAEYLEVPAGTALNPYERYLESKKAAKRKSEIPEEKSPAYILPEEGKEGSDYIRKILLSESEDAQQPPVEENPFKRIFASKILWILPLIIIVSGIYLLNRYQKSVPPAAPKAQQQDKIPETPAADLAADKSQDAAQKILQETKSSSAKDSKPSVEPPVKQEGVSAYKSQPPVPSGDAKTQDAAAAQKESVTVQKKKHNLSISATGKTWIQILIDGTETRDIMLNPGEKISYGADDTFTLLIGNAAGIKLNYDGKTIENLGAEGEVVKLNLPGTNQQQQAPVIKKELIENGVHSREKEKTESSAH